MPKEDTTTASDLGRAGPPSGPLRPPLRRGDACLYCRRRRIRCNAAKPTCQSCAKLRRVCEYDVGKPVSRVRQLEDRIAELEGMLQSSGTPASSMGLRASASAPSMPTAPLAVDSFSMRPAPPSTSQVPAADGVDGPDYDWNILDPGFLSLVNDLSQTSVPGASRSTTVSHPTTISQSMSTSVGMQPPTQQSMALQQHLEDMPAQLGSVVQRVPFPVPPVPEQGGAADPLIRSRVPLSLRPPEVPLPLVASVPEPQEQTDPPPPPHPLRPQLTFNNVPVAGWWDPNDLPPEARDQLLGMFFNSLKLFNIFHIPRFMARLTLSPSKRPHPCLLYAMYLLAAFRSLNPALAALESHFLRVATKRLNEAVPALDRIFDATRAAAIIAVYRFQKGQYQAGIMMNAQAVQLALGLGLHQITSSVWRLPKEGEGAEGGPHPSMRQRSWMCAPAADAVEHAERIHAFWAIYATDRTSALASQWPALIAMSDIITPYPRPIYEYELGIVSLQDDYSLRSMWDGTRPRHVLPHHTPQSHHILFLRAVSLMERASKLMYLPDEQGAAFPLEARDFEYAYNLVLFDIDGFLHESNRHLSQSLPTPTSAEFDASRTASVRTPKAFEEVRRGLLSVEADLPPHQRTNWAEPHDGSRGWWEFELWTPEVSGLINMLGIAWMFLYDVYAPYAENSKAVNIARRLVVAMRSRRPGDYKGRDEDLIVTLCWSFVSMILVREMHRLHAAGEHVQAAVIKVDLDTVIDGLCILGLAQMSGSEGSSRSASAAAARGSGHTTSGSASASDSASGSGPGSVPGPSHSSSEQGRF